MIHESPSVVAQTLASVNRRDVDRLVDHHLKTKNFWSAARVCHGLWSCIHGHDRMKYILKTIDYVKHVKEPGALTIQVFVCCYCCFVLIPLHHAGEV